MFSTSKKILIACKTEQTLDICHLTMTNARLYTLAKKNREHKYGQGKQPHEIEKSLVERDLGLLVSSDLKWAN